MRCCADIAAVRTPQQLHRLKDLPEQAQALVDTLERLRDGDGAVLQEGIAHLSQTCTGELWPFLAQACCLCSSPTIKLWSIPCPWQSKLSLRLVGAL